MMDSSNENDGDQSRSDDQHQNADQSSDQHYPYGMEGGRKYFETLVKRDFLQKAKEHQLLSKYLDHAFGGNIPCWLLPHPGEESWWKNLQNEQS